MKEQILSCVLPELPIVGTLKLTSSDGKTLSSISVVKKQKPSKLDPFFEDCFDKIKAYLSGTSKEIGIKLDLSGLTPFQIRVLKQMAKIPFGKVVTYKDLALGIKSKGYQAIGTACGKNPFILVYPCHRVVGSQDLGGFSQGLKMKKELLGLEGVL